jgi:cytochrome c oxidase subunit 4
MAQHSSQSHTGEIPKANTKHIWKTFWILLGVTGLEFLFAFTMPRGVLLTVIFVTLTIVKAFYIVAEFMHLKHEVKVLIWSILIPTVFIIWMLVAFLIEGSAIGTVR